MTPTGSAQTNETSTELPKRTKGFLRLKDTAYPTEHEERKSDEIRPKQNIKEEEPLDQA